MSIDTKGEEDRKNSPLIFAKMMYGEAEENVKFMESSSEASKPLKLLVDLWNYIEDAYLGCYKKFPTISLTLLCGVQPQCSSMVYNFLLGNLSACYMSMRVCALIFD